MSSLKRHRQASREFIIRCRVATDNTKATPTPSKLPGDDAYVSLNARTQLPAGSSACAQ